jgi:hypothetical protein
MARIDIGIAALLEWNQTTADGVTLRSPEEAVKISSSEHSGDGMLGQFWLYGIESHPAC